ncbi:NUDIX domain-containing protein [Allorhizocola rhizosphaerae]|uniref:NUDIX domain-containing protein n=1 Tax=Allorhizocola rhizosphaerae TaxID=1872709 RepID=UPI0013C30CAB|nr:NUDIX hydrolase [Allorhizocola rhizosphaerae]
MSIVLVALVNRHGELLLRMRDEQSAVRANRWSLIGGACGSGESPKQAAIRLTREQTGLAPDPAGLRLAWRGSIPDPLVQTFLYAARIPAATADITTDAIPGALARRGEYVVQFVPGPEVQSGRAFSPASGFVVGPFLDSRLYRELAEGLDLDELA